MQIVMERETIKDGREKMPIWLNVSENIIIISAMLIFTLNYTVIGIVRGIIFSPLKNLIMLALFVLFIYRFITVSKQQRKRWFTDRFLYVPSAVWLILFFAVRCLCFAVEDFQYGVLREIFFEFVFLVVICGWTVGRQVKVELLAFVFCAVNFIVNIANTYCVHILDISFQEGTSEGGWLKFLTGLSTYYDAGASGYNNAILYSNPNSAGIMTGMAILLSLLFIKKRKYIPIMTLYWIYSLYVLWKYDSRGAILSFVVSLICILLMKAFRFFTPKRLVAICLIASSMAAVFIYGYIAYNMNDNDRTLSSSEEKINSLSTGRYIIWQDCYISHSDKWALGTGSPTLEKDERNEYLKSQYISNYGTEEGYLPTTFSVHNGYLATIFITGWIGFGLFMIIMLDKIRKARALSARSTHNMVLASTVIFAFMVSNFEALLVTSRYYTILMVFIILAWGSDSADESERTLNAV